MTALSDDCRLDRVFPAGTKDKDMVRILWATIGRLEEHAALARRDADRALIQLEQSRSEEHVARLKVGTLILELDGLVAAHNRDATHKADLARVQPGGL